MLRVGSNARDMSPFIKLASKFARLPDNEAKEFTVGDKVICVANVNGTITAMDNVCLHRGGPVRPGTVEGDELVCRGHGWQGDPKTGEAAHKAVAEVA